MSNFRLTMQLFSCSYLSIKMGLLRNPSPFLGSPASLKTGRPQTTTPYFTPIYSLHDAVVANLHHPDQPYPLGVAPANKTPSNRQQRHPRAPHQLSLCKGQAFQPRSRYCRCWYWVLRRKGMSLRHDEPTCY